MGKMQTVIEGNGCICRRYELYLLGKHKVDGSMKSTNPMNSAKSSAAFQ